MTRWWWRVRYTSAILFHYGILPTQSWKFSGEWYDTMRKDGESMSESVRASGRFI